MIGTYFINFLCIFKYTYSLAFLKFIVYELEFCVWTTETPQEGKSFYMFNSIVANLNLLEKLITWFLNVYWKIDLQRRFTSESERIVNFLSLKSKLHSVLCQKIAEMQQKRTLKYETKINKSCIHEKQLNSAENILFCTLKARFCTLYNHLFFKWWAYKRKKKQNQQGLKDITQTNKNLQINETL